MPPIEAIRPTEAAQGRHRCPRSPRPLADRASHRSTHQPHRRHASDPEYQHGIQYEVDDVHADGDPEWRAHVMSTAQRPEGCQAHEHRGEPDQPVLQVVHGKRSHGSAGTHRLGGLTGEQRTGDRNNHAGNGGNGHRYQAHAGGASVDNPLASQSRHVRLRGDAEEAEGPRHRRQQHGARTQRSQRLHAQSGDERCVNQTGQGLRDERAENGQAQGDQRPMRMPIEALRRVQSSFSDDPKNSWRMASGSLGHVGASDGALPGHAIRLPSFYGMFMDHGVIVLRTTGAWDKHRDRKTSRRSCDLPYRRNNG